MSSRLIESLELYNWPKKKSAFINLEDEGDTCKEEKVVGEKISISKQQRAQVIVNTPRGVSTTRHILASPMGKKDDGRAMESGSVEEEDEFVTRRPTVICQCGYNNCLWRRPTVICQYVWYVC